MEVTEQAVQTTRLFLYSVNRRSWLCVHLVNVWSLPAPEVVTGSLATETLTSRYEMFLQRCLLHVHPFPR